MADTCKNETCEQDASDNTGSLPFIAVNLIGPNGKNLTEGYCADCAMRHVWMLWLSLNLLMAVLLMFAVLEDWRISAFGILNFVCWLALFKRQIAKSN